MRIALALGVVFLALPGCVSTAPNNDGTSPAPGGPSPRLADLGPVPPGCDVTRTAVAHHAGGVQDTAADLERAPIPCIVATGHNSIEPTLGISANGTVFHYPADVVYYPNVRDVPTGVGTMRSRDGGGTWDLMVPRLGPVPTHPATEDPYLYLDPATGRLFVEDLLATINCGGLSISDDEGETWTETVTGCTTFDHQSYAAGPPVTSTTQGYPNVVYRCAIDLVALASTSSSSACQKSIDGGLTWLHTGEPAFQYPVFPQAPLGPPSQSCAGAHGHIAVDARGWLYVPRGYCGQPWLAISKDEGLSWDRMQVADLGLPTDEAAIEDHEGDIGIDPAGNLYYTWVAKDRLPYLVTSKDGGATWSEPRMVGMPGVVETTLPQLAVGGIGKIAFLSMQSQDSPGPPWPECEIKTACVPGPAPDYSTTSWSGVLTVSWDALDDGATFWSAALDPPGDPLVRGRCGPVRCSSIYDFLDVRIGPDGTPWAALADACEPGCTLSPTGSGTAQGAVGRFWAGASLWDAADPNGPYP